jgi:lysophospholipase L1-like esterase
VIEDCLNGRRTVWDDPFKPGRNGLVGLAQRIEVSSPLGLVVLMLGTNDFQSMHDNGAWHAAQGVAALVGEIRRAPLEPGMTVPPVLIVAPPAIGEPRGTIAPKFAGGDRRCAGVADAYREVASALGCPFFDAGSVVQPSGVDGVHLDAAAHRVLADALADVIRPLIP